MFWRWDIYLTSSSAWTSTSSLLPQLRSCTLEGLVDSQASRPFSFVVVCTQTCNASVACMLWMMGHVTPVCIYAMWLFWAFIYMSLHYVVMSYCTTHTCMLCVRVTCIAMCGIRQSSCLSLAVSLMGKCSLVLPWAIVVRYSPVHRSPASPALLLRTLDWPACVPLRSCVCPFGEMSRGVYQSPVSLL